MRPSTAAARKTAAQSDVRDLGCNSTFSMTDAASFAVSLPKSVDLIIPYSSVHPSLSWIPRGCWFPYELSYVNQVF